jgi:hypothetical protein
MISRERKRWSESSVITYLLSTFVIELAEFGRCRRTNQKIVSASFLRQLTDTHRSSLSLGNDLEKIRIGTYTNHDHRHRLDFRRG